MAAGARTWASLSEHSEAARQSTSLVESFSTAVASVKHAEARLFPWGIAAINEAATATAEVITETQGTMGVQSSTSLYSYELGDHVDRRYGEQRLV